MRRAFKWRKDGDMSGKTVLVVDNDAGALQVVARGLQTRGYSVIKTDRSPDTIILAKSNRPDVILLDLLMPDMDGAAVAASLKEDPQTCDIPIIFTTCLFSNQEQSGRKDHIIAGHMTFPKPYDIDELAGEMEKLI